MIILMMRIVLFTDLDGTLLNDRYEFEEALEVIEELKRKEIPIIFCSAKTKAEQEYYRKKMGIDDPFIVEDGSAVYIPKGYFGLSVGVERGDYEVIELGVERGEIIRVIERLRKRYRVESFYFMSDEEVARVTGLSLEMARLARDREYSETIVYAEEGALEELKRYFNVKIGGRFYHVYGRGADKGKAVRVLKDLFGRKFGEVFTVGIGNSYTDEPMLREVDLPAVVKNPDSWPELNIKNLYKAKGIATSGWVEVVRRFVLR